MFKKRLIRNIGQRKSRELIIMRSWEKWRLIEPEGVSGKALDPQRISRTTFGFIS